ncbi:MAG: hypothetical protein ABIR36_05940 [Nitrospiraceae bacterium]
MSRQTIVRSTTAILRVMCGVLVLCLTSSSVWAQGKAEKVFHALATDTKGIETDVKNVMFYWEEKVSETAFVPHELREVPVKRGTATVKIKFEAIKQIDLKSTGSGTPPNVTITLNDGKTGEFVLAMAGSFKGQSDFGEVELPAAELKKLTFK